MVSGVKTWGKILSISVSSRQVHQTCHSWIGFFILKAHHQSFDNRSVIVDPQVIDSLSLQGNHGFGNQGDSHTNANKPDGRLKLISLLSHFRREVSFEARLKD